MKVPLIIYLVEVLDNISKLLAFVFVISLIAMFIALLILAFNSDMAEFGNEYQKKAESAKKIIKNIFAVFCVVAFLGIFIPSKKTIYLMIGGYAAESIYESDEAKAFGNRILNIVNSKLDEIEKSTKDKK